MNPVEVDDVMMAFPAEVSHMMPPMEEIPEEFTGSQMAPAGTDWNRLFRDCFYFGLTEIQLVPKEGIDPEMAWRHLHCVMASYEPKHEHKEAAWAYLASQWYEGAAWKAKAEMSLVVEVRVNNEEPLAVLVIQRTQGGTEPDSQNTYRYTIMRRGSDMASHMGFVEHRYGDGALTLLRKVCETADL